MELVQKLMKKTSKYLIYCPLPEKVLTECPCILLITKKLRELHLEGQHVDLGEL